MKKGQKVRILRTNQIARIKEIELIRKNGRVHQYCYLDAGKHPDLWLDASELGGLKEVETVTFRNEDGREAVVMLTHDYAQQATTATIDAVSPDDLRQHDGGLHGFSLAALLKGIRDWCDGKK